MSIMEEIFNEFGLDPAPKRKCDISGIKRKYMDIPYCKNPDGNFNMLDIYLPDEKCDIYPVLLQIHGGGFLMGDKRDYLLGKYLKGLKRGYAVVSVNYHYSSEKKFPYQIQEIKTAIRFLRENRKKYFLDTDKIAVGGESAGGYLASMIGCTAGDEYFEGRDMGSPKENSNVSCCVDFYGPTNMLLHDEHMRELNIEFVPNDNPRSPNGFFLGDKMSNIPSVCEKANPLNYVKENTSPIIIFHGRQDSIVPMKQSEIFYDKLKDVIGNRAEFHIVEGVGHENEVFETDEITDIMYNFIDKYTK